MCDLSEKVRLSGSSAFSETLSGNRVRWGFCNLWVVSVVQTVHCFAFFSVGGGGEKTACGSLIDSEPLNDDTESECWKWTVSPLTAPQSTLCQGARRLLDSRPAVLCFWLPETAQWYIAIYLIWSHDRCGHRPP